MLNTLSPTSESSSTSRTSRRLSWSPSWDPYEDPKPKAIKVKKDASQEAYEAATAEGLTHFVTVRSTRMNLTSPALSSNG